MTIFRFLDEHLTLEQALERIAAAPVSGLHVVPSFTTRHSAVISRFENGCTDFGHLSYTSRQAGGRLLPCRLELTVHGANQPGPIFIALSGLQFGGTMTVHDTEAAAFDWLREQVDDDCMSHTRFAYVDDPEAQDEYQRITEDGCCGFYDAPVLVAGREASIGCCYGH